MAQKRKPDPRSVVTVRMSGELHQRLLYRAAVERVRRRLDKFSLNDLCVEALDLHDRRLGRERTGGL